MSYLEDSISLLRQMVRTPSFSFEEDAVRALISSALDSWDVPHFVEGNDIIALCEGFDPSRKTLALDAHIDTVPACSGYTRDPFDPGDDTEIIHGLGSNDDGGCVAAMIAVFRELRQQPLPFNLMLTLSCEEERSGPKGARWLYADDGLLARDGRFAYPDMVIVGEPTSLRCADSERGLLVLDGMAEGVSGHAGRGEGINAIYIALRDIEALRSHAFSDPAIHLSVNQIEGGSAHNVTPDRCSFVVDIRTTASQSNEDMLSTLQAICKSKLTPRNMNNRASASFPGSPLVQAVKDLGIETFSSPTTSDWMRMHCDAIKIGPGDSSRSHKPDEYITREEIEDGIVVYRNIIKQLYVNTLE